MKNLDSLLEEAAHTAFISEVITKGLEDLGKDSDKVANNLIDNEILGKRLEPASCPVALYLHEDLEESIPESFSIKVDPSRVIVDTVKGIHLDIKTPRGVSDFVKSFDAGNYPELEESRLKSRVLVKGVGDFYVPLTSDTENLEEQLDTEYGDEDE